MLKTLIYYENYEIYLYFGVFSSLDYDFVHTVVKFFDITFSSTFPSKSNFEGFLLTRNFNDELCIENENKKNEL